MGVCPLDADTKRLASIRSSASSGDVRIDGRIALRLDLPEAWLNRAPALTRR
jgi:hypothetical protein